MKKNQLFFICFFILSCFINISKAQTPSIFTIAGNGVYAFSGDGGPATNAQLDFPQGLAFDSIGNLFITEYHNNRVRKVNTSGIITTFAGNGIGAFSGDGAAATLACLNDPQDIAIDHSGNIYLTDLFNRRIRKINTTGIITTIAGTGTVGSTGDGGQATAADITPEGIAVDFHGNIYFPGGSGGNSVRKINTSNIISTIAGTFSTSGYSGDGSPATAAMLFSPMGAVCDKKGNLYIADYENNCIRKIDTFGIIHTFAGNGTSGFYGDGGPATNANLNLPKNVTVDKAGNIYINDYGNERIRKVDTFGIISTIAGNGVIGYSPDGVAATAASIGQSGGLACDSTGNIYFSDYYNNLVRKISTTGILSTLVGNSHIRYSGDHGPATNAELNNSAGVALDALGNIYIADGGNSCLRKVSTTSDTINTIAGSPTVSGFAGDGGPASAAKMANPINIAISPTGDIVFCDSGNSCLRKVSTTSDTINTIAGSQVLGAGFSGDGGPATAAQISNTASFCFDASGNIYIADGGNSCIRKVNRSTGIISTIIGTPTVSGFSGDGGPASVAHLNNPTAIAIDATGNIYFTDGGNNCLRKVSTTSDTINTIAGTPTVSGFSGDGGAALSAQFNNPSGIAITSSGKIFISDKGNNRMRVITTTGIIKTVAGQDTAGFNGDGLCSGVELNQPQGVCLDAYYNCYIADRFNNRIRYISYNVFAEMLDKPLSEMIISPNPSSGHFNVTINAVDKNEFKIVITNILGEKIKEFATNANQTIDVELNVAAGIYLINAISNNGILSGKLIVTNK